MNVCVIVVAVDSMKDSCNTCIEIVILPIGTDPSAVDSETRPMRPVDLRNEHC